MSVSDGRDVEERQRRPFDCAQGVVLSEVEGRRHGSDVGLRSRNKSAEAGSGYVRRPAVAGYYYAAGVDALRAELDALTTQGAPRAPARALIVPHGSYRSSGRIASAAFTQVDIPAHCILVGSSHAGGTVSWSLMGRGAYGTPLGEVPIDSACAQALQARCPLLEEDPWAHRGEHALEVQLPFLQRLGPADVTIVPIVTSSDDADEFVRVGDALAHVVRLSEVPTLLIASSDLSHYQARERAVSDDRVLLEAILALDVPALIRCVRETETRMCGAGAVVSVLWAAMRLGARHASIAGYGTSADAGGDPHAVTGYASVVIR